MSKIKNIRAREILASGGNPTIEVEVELESGEVGLASVPYGVSAGSKEAIVLVDGDMDRYKGKGMLKAVNIVETEIKKVLVGQQAKDQQKIDQIMIDLDGTENKSRLGGNSILAVSLAIARAGAKEDGLELYRYLRQVFGIDDQNWRLPQPMVVMIEGGKHADQTTDIQEYLVTIKKDQRIRDSLETEMEIYSSLRQVLKRQGLSINVGNEGAFAPSGIVSNQKPFEYLLEAIEKSGHKVGDEVALSIDAAASEFYNHQTGLYELKLEGRSMRADELMGYYLDWVKKYPIITVEDLLDENDWENWVKLTAKLGQVIHIGDDLTVTNRKLWQKAIDMKACNGILIKLNQAGSLTETVNCCLLAKQKGLITVPSHRGGGETDDSFMVDLAVAMGSAYIKVGPTRGERVSKYNRLMKIEEDLGR
ncbi:phosphopyruvate hydratase [Candidatus Shapirobacteria bacterium]|nr:MAG: phosphopyruvate hydratase [Candidatus Shapirobacteria bacterium]